MVIPDSATPHSRFARLAAKFFAVLGLLALAISAVGAVGVFGLRQTQSEAQQLYAQNLVTSQLTAALGSSLDDAAESALQLSTNDQESQKRLTEELDSRIVPAVTQGIEALRRAHAEDPPFERERVERIAAGWQRFLRLRRTGSLEAVGNGPEIVALNAALARRVATIFDPLTSLLDRMTAYEAAQALETRQHSAAASRRTALLIFAIAAAALAVGIASVLLLIRNVVPRVRDYSSFASEVAAGAATRRLAVQGRDEIAELGHVLNEMVERQQAQRRRGDAQGEFTEMMQVTEAEDEAHDLLKRHVERSIAASTVTVLNRNNSEDRLEARTALPLDSSLREALAGAKPRSCLAVRFGRKHHEGNGVSPLVSCEVCGGVAEQSTCEPLLVSGEVIGSVLVNHDRGLTDEEREAIGVSVTQAAPVLGNLRNLAIAELRAATDALTGLPNTRAAHDTLKRMVAQSFRTAAPLAAALLDLDHFKEINDGYGHGRGDEVLAAVGAVLHGAIRESDFVGRFGGEEFLLLLPDTRRDEALLVAENLRAGVSKISVPGVDRPITASLGIAVYPEDAADADTLVRHADRALYTAKANGRNRVEVSFAPGRHDGPTPDAAASTEPYAG